MNEKNWQISYYRLGPIEDDYILWKLVSWDKNDIKNKIYETYILLSKIVSEQYMYKINSEPFKRLYNELSNSTDKKELQFLGKVNYDSELDEWNIVTMTDIEREEIQEDIPKLIEIKERMEKLNKDCEKVLKKLGHANKTMADIEENNENDNNNNSGD